MKEQDLTVYKIIKFFEKCETREDDGDIIVWIPFYKLEEYTNLIGYDYFSEGGEEVNLQDNCIAFGITSVMEYFEICYEDLKELLESN